MKTILIIGAFGHGKSSTGNKLLERDVFNVGKSRNIITKDVSIETSEKYSVVDCPGFGELEEKKLFFLTFPRHKTALENICPIDGIVLVLKFDKDNCFSFSNTARQFMSAFDQEGLKSLMLLCIQGNEEIRFGNDKFREILLESSGYKYLVEQNNGAPIPFCLWDNFRPYQRQMENFEECLTRLLRFEKINMSYSFKLMSKELRILELEEQLIRNRPNNQ